MDLPLERQALRLAVTLAAASGRLSGDVDSAVQLRDCALHLAACVARDAVVNEELLTWSDEALSVCQRIRPASSDASEAAMDCHAAILRFRLSVLRAEGTRQRQARRDQLPDTPNATLPQVKVVPVEKVSIPDYAMPIFEYIRDHENVRSKDVIDHFSQTHSIRTVRRHLNELAALRAVARKSHRDNSVSYTARPIEVQRVDTKD